MTEKMRRRIALALSAALSIFNILHMFVGGLVGAALHARGLNYYVADGFARYSG